MGISPTSDDETPILPGIANSLRRVDPHSVDDTTTPSYDLTIDQLGMAARTPSGNWSGVHEDVPHGSTIRAHQMADDELSRSEFKSTQSRSFGKYELLGEIGRGGMGIVYKARQIDLDRIVALKMIVSSHLASADQVDRFRLEARAAAKVRSPNVVGIHEVGESAGQHYFAMEYIAGPSLSKLIAAGPVEPATAARVTMTVARTVADLHAQGIVHRDLKPSNILMNEAGEPLVSDFGLAKMLGGDGRMTHSDTIVGTPSYMAPEQASGRGEKVGPLSDVYSIGAILYELLTGRPPFREDSPLDTLVQVLEGEPARPRRIRPSVPRELEWICLKCLEKNPSERYPSAAALAEDLGRFVKNEPVEARKLGPWHRLRRWARREPALASRLGTMGICGAIIQINHSLIETQFDDKLGKSIAVVITWAIASIFFQALVRSERFAFLGRAAWASADICLFTTLVALNEGISTSQVSGYFLIVAASGLWFRERLVWLTTAMAVLGYCALVALDILSPQSGQVLPYRHVVFVTILAVSGLIVAYQVKRVRALSNYYEHRPLP